MNASPQPALRFLLDQGIPADAAPLFRAAGYECWHVSELGMQKAEDEDILTVAAERGFIVIALDADFHALMAVRRLHGPSVIRLRREGCRAEAVVEILRDVLVRYRPELLDGCLISVKEHRATCHRLPVGRDRDDK